MEHKTRNRGWVKNAVIVFLAVLLVLTFFSNTIMNRSLPEVATQYSQSGSITAKVRGSGTVAANENYEVSLNQSREVLSVSVRVGDIVEVGDPIILLKDKESTELKEAQDALEDLELGYQKALINATSADYAKENRNIQLAKEALEEAQTKRDEITYSDETIASLKQSVASQKSDVTTKEAQVKIAQDALDALGEYNPGTDSGDYTVVTQAKTAWDNAKTALEAVKLVYGADYDALRTVAMAVMRADVETAVMKMIYMDGKTYQQWHDALSPSDQTAFMNNEVKNKVESESKTEAWKVKEEAYIAAEAMKTPTSSGSIAYYAIKDAEDEVASKKAAYDSASNNYNPGSSGNSTQYNKLKGELTTAQSALETSKTKLTQFETALTEEQGKKTDWETASTAVKAAQVTLEDLIFGLSETQKATGKTQAVEALDLQASKDNIDDKREEVAKLKTGSVDSTILANVTGIVKSIGVSAGNTIEPNSAIMVIEVVDRGYSVSIPVTNEQSKRVRIGDSADVTTAYWGLNMNAVLTGIRTDKENPSTGKILVFNVTGDDVESGMQVNITLAQQSANYEMVVPNSAIREDNNGNFVLIIEMKSTPLGSRYIAKRIDVKILATDDTSSAISGGLSQWGDAVITTSTKPIEPGQQVRIADN